jgi:hypothetical protein
MAAAIPLFSSLFGEPDAWDNSDPDYFVLTAAFGYSPTSATAPVCKAGLVQLTARTPVVVAFVPDVDCDSIYVAHSLTLFPGDVTAPTGLDNLVVGLVGDRVTAVVPVVFPDAFFALTAAARALNVTALQGVNGHGAIPPVFRSGPHAAGAADTDSLRGRPLMIMPPVLAGAALSGAPSDGRYSLVGFFNTFIQPYATSADPVVVASIAPLANWWRLASTNNAAGNSVISSTLTVVNIPREQSRLNTWASSVKDSQLARLGVGGPGLSNAAFAHGVDEIRKVMTDTHEERLDFERQRNTKTFTDFHGEALAQQMHRLCGVTSDVNLPEVHSLLLQTAKGRIYAVLTSLFATRAQASPVALNVATAPVASTKLVDDVFKCYAPGGDGLTFGKGLSPFAIICPGHEGIEQVRKLMQQAQIVEAGTCTTLADAATITAEDVRFPTLPFVAVEKLYGWSVVVDVFHGVGHAVAINIRNAVTTIGPLLQRVAAQMGDTEGAGMELICRVMYDMTQDYFGYLTKVSAGVAATPPDFSRVIELVSTYRAESLSSLPAHWYTIVNCPRGRAAPQKVAPTAPASMKPVSGTASVTNANADRKLMNRYKSSGMNSITTMMGGRDLEFPKHNGSAVCMAWALKGSCSTNCKRSSQHVRYGQDTNKALHKFMDDCGVANEQP